jgi:xanthine dehydrogenase YagS FAD-binding subunit
MKPFEYARAAGLAEVPAVVGVEGTEILAGGTELLNWLRLGISDADRLLDIGGIGELKSIEDLPDGGLRIGATATLARIAADERVNRDWPALREAIEKAASPQIRNRATLGGNLLQKPRCPYLRSEDPAPCNRRTPGSGCAALVGVNAGAAIFGWDERCVATQPSDPAVALAALDATVVTLGAEGGRRIPIGELHPLPQDSLSDSVLAPGELIVAIELPAPAPASAYVKVRGRQSYEFALVSAAATVGLVDGRIERAAIALGSVALRPWRLWSAERELRGLAPDAPDATAAIDRALDSARPLTENAHKVAVARAAARRAMRIAAGLEERIA